MRWPTRFSRAGSIANRGQMFILQAKYSRKAATNPLNALCSSSSAGCAAVRSPPSAHPAIAPSNSCAACPTCVPPICSELPLMVCVWKCASFLFFPCCRQVCQTEKLWLPFPPPLAAPAACSDEARSSPSTRPAVPSQTPCRCRSTLGDRQCPAKNGHSPAVRNNLAHTATGRGLREQQDCMRSSDDARASQSWLARAKTRKKALHRRQKPHQSACSPFGLLRHGCQPADPFLIH